MIVVPNPSASGGHIAEHDICLLISKFLQDCVERFGVAHSPLYELHIWKLRNTRSHQLAVHVRVLASSETHNTSMSRHLRFPPTMRKMPSSTNRLHILCNQRKNANFTIRIHQKSCNSPEVLHSWKAYRVHPGNINANNT